MTKALNLSHGVWERVRLHASRLHRQTKVHFLLSSSSTLDLQQHTECMKWNSTDNTIPMIYSDYKPGRLNILFLLPRRKGKRYLPSSAHPNSRTLECLWGERVSPSHADSTELTIPRRFILTETPLRLHLHHQCPRRHLQYRRTEFRRRLRVRTCPSHWFWLGEKKIKNKNLVSDEAFNQQFCERSELQEDRYRALEALHTPSDSEPHQRCTSK